MGADIVGPLRTLFSAPIARFRGGPDIEVHTLVCGAHVPLYLFAAKSLARHWPDLTPVVHDDGTLTDLDCRRIQRHVGAVRVIDRQDADERVGRLLHQYPLLSAVRATNVRILQLIDYFLLSETNQIIGMDSDVIFLRRPTTLISWATNPHDHTVYLYSPEEGWEPSGVRWIPHHLPGERYISAMCCGFVAVRGRNFLDLDYLEHTLSRLPEQIRFAPKFVTQMCYSLLGGRLDPTHVRSLGQPYRSGPQAWLPEIEGQVLCHYFAGRENGLTPGLLTEAAQLFTANTKPISK